jgi:hypothetical protein
MAQGAKAWLASRHAQVGDQWLRTTLSEYAQLTNQRGTTQTDFVYRRWLDSDLKETRDPATRGPLAALMSQQRTIACNMVVQV